jgi:hypothetical protein
MPKITAVVIFLCERNGKKVSEKMEHKNSLFGNSISIINVLSRQQNVKLPGRKSDQQIDQQQAFREGTARNFRGS